MDLSIIIPMYNCEKYLDELFLSINKIELKNIEIILVDDGSKDNTFEKACELIKNKINMFVYHNDNHGVAFSRNFAMDKANGKYIMFIDSDDLLVEGWYEIVKKVMKENENEDLMVFSKESIKNIFSRKELLESILGITDIYKNLYLQTPWSKIYKKDFLKKNNIRFNEKVIHGEDSLFNIKCVLNANKIKMVNQSIYKYRINMNSVTHKYNQYYLKSNIIFLDELEKILIKSKLYSKEDIDQIILYSLQNSLYIFARKISKIDKIVEKKKVIKMFYNDDFYKKNLKRKCSIFLEFKKKIIFFIIKYKLLFFLETSIHFLKLLRKNYITSKNENFIKI